MSLLEAEKRKMHEAGDYYRNLRNNAAAAAGGHNGHGHATSGHHLGHYPQQQQQQHRDMVDYAQHYNQGRLILTYFSTT